MREVYRYVVVAADGIRELEDSLTRAIIELWGLRGLAEVEASVVVAEEREGLAIVRVKREGLHLFRAAIAAHPKPLVRIIRVAGTLRKAREILLSIERSTRG